MKTPLRVLSLGAGVQSSALALMYSRGEMPNPPDLAIFADPGAESPATYDWLDRIEPEFTFPLVRVTAGNLADDVLNAVATGARCALPPVFTRQDDRAAPLMRQCTREYKVDVILREIRRILGAAARARIAKGSVVQLFGITIDEAQRMRDSHVSWIANEYPLVFERPMDRNDCIRWLESNGYGRPPKSKCFFCPYANDSSWRDMRDNHPEEWTKAVAFDKAIRTGLPGVRNEAYLHRSLVPLDEVDLTTLEDHGQGTLFAGFGAECEGMCGV